MNWVMPCVLLGIMLHFKQIPFDFGFIKSSTLRGSVKCDLLTNVLISKVLMGFGVR